ncbi:MAG: exodeoxyribonuclease VII small subunit [Acidiphilium sp. 21-60-14]|nr:MAG: exodeoxyribonuclease VII small subunit [Acidiphilium sp. 21-60-14]OYV89496.1 MAG: exodeoxyribonuclease VII small subunit [Acidiphilium sp. 37-60-79]OZB38176.1 MAG: exodeoxyribonuclease VII small subunit [Acidiphilium sp. 34-60-192]
MPAIATMSFEAALAELETIVRGLESGQQSLAQAIAAYERGDQLKRHCEARLAEAEQLVQSIVTRADGALALSAAQNDAAGA